MKIINLTAILFSIVAFCFGQAAIRPDVSGVTGAVITETIAKTYYVNQNGGSDSNSGTEADKALLTIKKAITLAKSDVVAGKATKVLVYPGTYRETLGTVNFGTGLGKKTLFVLEGTSANEVIISGSDIYTGWNDEGGGIYSHTWNYDFGNNYMDWSAQLVGHRSEMVFINGTPLIQNILENYTLTGNKFDVYKDFASPSSVLKSGTFGVAERTTNGNKLFIYPESGSNPEGKLVEVSVRHEFVNFSTKENIILRNLVVQHFANRLIFPWSSENTIGFAKYSKNILVEGCNFLWNNGGGFSFAYSSDITINNCNFSYNGFNGFGTDKVSNCLMKNSSTNFNMWRDYQSGIVGWFASGQKHHQCQGMKFENVQSIGNLMNGIWFDIHCKDVQIDKTVCAYNLFSGLVCEISEGPFLVSKSLLACNGVQDIDYYTVGEFILENSILYADDNARNLGAFNLKWYPRPGNEHWEIGEYKPGHITLNNNIYSAKAKNKMLWIFANNPSEPQLRAGYRANGNTYYHSSINGSGRFYAADWDYSTDKALTNLSGWVTYIGATKEVDSQWKDPEFEDPDHADFRFKTDSPLKPKECLYLSTAIDTTVLNACQRFFKLYKYDMIVGTRNSNPTSNCANFSPVSGISVSPEAKSMIVGETLQLEKTVTPSNAEIQTVMWSSSNLLVATVSKTGLATAIAEGAATITAVSNDGSYSANSRMVVSTKSDISNIAIDKPSKAVSQQLNYRAKDGNDGNSNTRWSAAAGTFPQGYTVNLESKYDVSSTEIDWATTTQTYKYKIEVSADNVKWTMLVDKTASGVKGNAIDNVAAAEIQYIKVTVTDVTGGEFASINEFKVYGKPNITSAEIIKNSKLTIFPNPAKNCITFQGMDNGIPADLSIYDMNGKIMLTKAINSENSTVDIQNLVAGIYCVKVDSNGMQSEFKFVKTKN